jgi:ParB/RepB/Spo0J family partition protein
MNDEQCIQEIDLADIGQRYGEFRIVNPRAEAAMLRSMQTYGQVSPVVCVKAAGRYELIDGYKRLRACQGLNKPSLRVKALHMSARACKAAIIALNRSGRSLSDMEEALVVQSLYRQDGLTQAEIATLLGRHKSWASRRISLVERISEEVQEDIRLGLIAASIAREVAKLPRGNQKAAVDAVMKHRLSTRETQRLVAHLMSRPRWDHQAILAAPWQIIEPRQSRPAGIEARLLSFARMCRSLSEAIAQSGPRNRGHLQEPIQRAIGAAQDVVTTLRAVSADEQGAR